VAVDLLDLSGCGAERAIAALLFSALQCVERATDSDEDDIDAGHDGQAILKAPWLAEDVVHDDVVSGPGHSGDRAVETGSGSS
jgi:hypothetical protein